MRASISSSSAGVTRSVLLIRITSAKAIWFLASGASLSRSLEPLGVGDRDHRVEFGLGADRLVHEEGLRHRRGVGEPRGLDDDGVELALAPHQPVDDAHQVAAHGAADAAVVHLEHFFVGVDHQLVVDADLAEFVDDDGVFLAVRLGQNAVEQRGLAGAEIAGEHGDGDFGGGGGGGHWGMGLREGGDIGDMGRRCKSLAPTLTSCCVSLPPPRETTAAGSGSGRQAAPWSAPSP